MKVLMTTPPPLDHSSTQALMTMSLSVALSLVDGSQYTFRVGAMPRNRWVMAMFPMTTMMVTAVVVVLRMVVSRRGAAKQLHARQWVESQAQAQQPPLEILVLPVVAAQTCPHTDPRARSTTRS